MRCVDGEQPRRLGVVVHDRDDDVTEQFVGLLDDVDVAEVHRVEAARVQHTLGDAGVTMGATLVRCLGR